MEMNEWLRSARLAVCQTKSSQNRARTSLRAVREQVHELPVSQGTDEPLFANKFVKGFAKLAHEFANYFDELGTLTFRRKNKPDGFGLGFSK